jgi:RNA polymerase sigma-70 factor (ECF subfamily)
MNELTKNILADPSIPEESLTEMLVERYYVYIVRLAASILRDVAEAEDVAQDTFVAALTSIQSVDPDTNLKAWLSTIAVNKCRDLLRKRQVKQKFQTVLEMFWHRPDVTSQPEYMAVQGETAVCLWTAVDQLKEKHRLPILLRYMYNLSIREIADILHTREGTIHSRLHYACKQLQHQLELNDLPARLMEGVSR